MCRFCKCIGRDARASGPDGSEDDDEDDPDDVGEEPELDDDEIKAGIRALYAFGELEGDDDEFQAGSDEEVAIEEESKMVREVLKMVCPKDEDEEGLAGLAHDDVVDSLLHMGFK